jgi:ABC-2 type transport system permease protein
MPIFDQGYQHWSGELSSQTWRWLVITRRGLKTTLQGRWVRLAILFAWLPALILAFVLCMWGLVERQSELVETFKPFLTGLLGRPVLAGPREYRVDIWTLCFHYFLTWELGFIMLLVLLAGPNLISQDLRYNALPLYFSRPLRRIDYFAGKLGVIASLIGLIVIGPILVAYALGLLFSLDITIVRATLPILIGSVVYGLVIAISAGLLMLAMSSLTRNSRYVALLWLGMWLITWTVSFVLIQVDQAQRSRAVGARHHRWDNEQFLATELKAAKSDWRPLVSYTSNLRRIEERLLNTNAAWQRLIALTPEGQRGRLTLQIVDTQYPWYWSAAVLFGLAMLSVGVLNVTVKSLDRIK